MNLTRRKFAQLATMAAASTALRAQNKPDFTLNIAPYLLEASPRHHLQPIAYNNQIPGPLLRMTEGRPITIEVNNHSADPELVHFHSLFLPPATDGAMEEGTPMIAPGDTARYTFTPDPPGFRWFHTHTFAGKNLRKGQYTGQHGFLLIDPASPAPANYDHEIFLALHDWSGYMMPSDDGSLMPVYDFCTINGKMLGFGPPLQVKLGDRILLQVLNSSPTEVHWLALPGHTFQVIALDGNPVPAPKNVDALRLAPAERITAIVEMDSPGHWILGELREHLQSAGMGIQVEYANSTGDAKWLQPKTFTWSYNTFLPPTNSASTNTTANQAEEIHLTFDSKFRGHGNPELWTINGKSYPHTEQPILKTGQRYRLIIENKSTDDHPIHLHRHTFKVISIAGDIDPTQTTHSALMKDVLLVPAKSTAVIEFLANHPDPNSTGKTLFHCHQQDHMDNGFMMLFRYA